MSDGISEFTPDVTTDISHSPPPRAHTASPDPLKVRLPATSDPSSKKTVANGHRPAVKRKDEELSPPIVEENTRRKRIKTKKAASVELDDDELEQVLLDLEAEPSTPRRKKSITTAEKTSVSLSPPTQSSNFSQPQAQAPPPPPTAAPFVPIPQPVAVARSGPWTATGSVSPATASSETFSTKPDTTAGRPNANHESYFWSEKGSRLFAVGHELQTDSDEILEFPPGSYLGPMRPDDLPESEFVRTQTCVPNCKFTVSHGKRPATIKDHFIRCGERESEFRRSNEVDVLARLYTLQVDAQRRYRAVKRTEEGALPGPLSDHHNGTASVLEAPPSEGSRHVSSLPRRAVPAPSPEVAPTPASSTSSLPAFVTGEPTPPPPSLGPPASSVLPPPLTKKTTSSAPPRGRPAAGTYAAVAPVGRPRKSKVSYVAPVSASEDDEMDSGRGSGTGDGDLVVGKPSKPAASKKTKPEGVVLTAQEKEVADLSKTALDCDFSIIIHGDASLLPQVTYLVSSSNYPTLLRPRSIAHESRGSDTISTFAFVVPGRAVAKRGTLCVSMESDVLHVPAASDIVLGRAKMGLIVKDGQIAWNFGREST